MLVFVVGPSGVGKTTLLAKAKAALPVDILDLDAEDGKRGGVEWAEGWEGRRWLRDRERLATAEEQAKSRTIIVDVGAGSLQTSDGRSYFQAHRDRTIAVVAPWETVLHRRRPGWDPDEFRATEYSQERVAVYEGARLSVDAGSKGEQEAASDLICAVRTLLEEAGSA